MHIVGIFKHSQDLCRAQLCDSCTKEERAQVLGKFNSISSVGFVLGPILGGHIAAYQWGFNVCALMCATIFLLNFGMIFYFYFTILEPTKHFHWTVLDAFFCFCLFPHFLLTKNRKEAVTAFTKNCVSCRDDEVTYLGILISHWRVFKICHSWNKREFGQCCIFTVDES